MAIWIAAAAPAGLLLKGSAVSFVAILVFGILVWLFIARARSGAPLRPIRRLAALDGWILLITLLGTLAYFFFTVERKGTGIKLGASIGRWTLMVALGASFASTLLFRWTLAFGRVDFLLHTWLKL